MPLTTPEEVTQWAAIEGRDEALHMIEVNQEDPMSQSELQTLVAKTRAHWVKVFMMDQIDIAMFVDSFNSVAEPSLNVTMEK